MPKGTRCPDCGDQVLHGNGTESVRNSAWEGKLPCGKPGCGVLVANICCEEDCFNLASIVRHAPQPKVYLCSSHSDQEQQKPTVKHTVKKVIYVASRLRGDIDFNISVAKWLARKLIVESGGILIPFVPHLHFTQFLNEDDEIERGVGMDAARHMINVCDELWAFTLFGCSTGMEDEMVYAQEHDKTVLEIATFDEWEKCARS